MSEEQEVQEPEGEPTEAPPEPPANDMIEKANAAAERLEKATAALEKENSRRESLAVKQALGGSGTVQHEKKEEDPKDYAKKVLAGELN